MSITLRPISVQDLPALTQLAEELTGHPVAVEQQAKNFAWISQRPDYLVLGAYEDNELLGTATGILCPDLVNDCRPFVVMENLIVAPQARGRGLGKQLIHGIEAFAKENNCAYLFFVSRAERKEAHRFYEAMGYRNDVVKGYKKEFSSRR